MRTASVNKAFSAIGGAARRDAPPMRRDAPPMRRAERRLVRGRESA